MTGTTTATLKDIATFQAAGWSIGPWASSGTTWGMCPSVNDGYPYLQVFYASDPCGSSTPPPPWFKAYARDPGQACLTNWQPSWAEWPNGGTGGFVCVQTLVYDIPTGTWIVRHLRLPRVLTMRYT